MDASRKIGHLKTSMVSLNPARMKGVDSLTKMKVEAAQIRHAEMLIELRKLEAELAECEAEQLRGHFEKLIENLRPQIKYAFDTIRPYTFH